MPEGEEVIITASLINSTPKAWQLNCEGDIEWFPKSQCSFDKEKEELTAPVWLLKEKFPDEEF